MIAIPGKNPMGNVLHLIVGPETQLVMDVQGSAIMDITQLINKFDAEAPVFVNLTRSTNEATTADNLKKADVPHMKTTADMVKCDGNCDTCKEHEAHEDPKLDLKGSMRDMMGEIQKAIGRRVDEYAKAPKAPAKLSTTSGACAYCKTSAPLLPIPGFKICVSCAQIELGVRRKKDVNHADTASNIKA